MERIAHELRTDRFRRHWRFCGVFCFGGISFGLLPTLKDEFRKYPAVYREQEGIMKVMPAGMAFMFLAIAALAVIYALMYRDGWGAWEGARFGALIGIYSVGSFVVHNYVNLNIGLKLTVQQSIAYFVQWTICGVVMGLIYRPGAQ